MKKYFLLSLLFVILISCKEDDEKDDGFSFDGTVTYYLYNDLNASGGINYEDTEIKVYNKDGLITDSSNYPENFNNELDSFLYDTELHYRTFQINNNFLYQLNDGVTDTIPIVIEGDEIFVSFLEFKIKLFDITEDGLEMKSYFLYHLDVEEDSESENTQSSNLDDELKSEFETIKANLGEGDVVGFVERTNVYGDQPPLYNSFNSKK